MKTLILLFSYTILLSVLFIKPQIVSAQNDSLHANFLKVEKLSNYDNFYKSGNLYFAGQPNLEQFKWLKEQGVNTIINLRSDEENNEFTKMAFSEEDLCKQLEINYISIPIKGNDSYNEKTLTQFAESLSQNNGKVLIHCKGAGRATILMMGYLIKYKNFTMDEAEIFGKQLTYFSAINGLLGK